MDSKAAIWIGALASVALVILVLLQKSSDDGGSVNVGYTISGITPDIAAIYSSERIANLQTKKETLLGWFGLQSALTESENAKTVSLAQNEAATKLGITISNNERELGVLQSNNERELGLVASNSVVQATQVQALSNQQVAQIQADAEKYAAKQQNKGKNISAIGNVIGSVAKIFSFL